MGGASSYYSILCFVAFYISIWFAAKASKLAGISSIVLEISTGLVLGPQVGSLIPEEYSVCAWEKTISCSQGSPDLDRIAADSEHNWCDLDAYAAANRLGSYQNSSSTRRLGGSGDVRYDTYSECLRQSCIMDLASRCQQTPNILTMIGHTGVAMMIFESGMHFDFNQLRAVGPKACVVAVVGTALPLVSGAALITYGFGFNLFPDGVSAGTSLAPTSVGIALRLLHEANALNKPFGQAIITAAFVDDILSLVLFNILFSMGGGSFTFVRTILPVLLGCVFMAVAAVMAVKFWPPFIAWLLSKIPEEEEDEERGSKPSRRDAALFLLMVTVFVAHAQITQLCGTHLWGCFTGGMSFALVRQAHKVWVKQTKRIAVWMMRTFFAATVAFAIPVDELLSVPSLWKGAIMGIGPCILSKVLCAIFMGRPRFVIGWAMVGRAEFAYLIAQMAVAANLMEPECFSIVIWSLLWATIFAPFVFRIVLQRYVKALALEEGADPETLERNKSQWHKKSKLHGSAYLGEIVLQAEIIQAEAPCKTDGKALEEFNVGGPKVDSNLQVSDQVGIGNMGFNEISNLSSV